MRVISTFYTFSGLLSIMLCSIGCKKLVQIPEPVNTITTSETFATQANAQAALAAAYYDLSVGYNQNFDYGNGLTTMNAGLSADELNYFDASNSAAIQFQENTLLSNNYYIPTYFWSPAYYDIFLANSVIEGVEASSGIAASAKGQLIGEAKFIRAFCNFYLVNLFGDIPVVTSTAWAHTGTLARSPSKDVYQQILSDLKDAQQLLAGNYSAPGGERIRANKWAATALLARTYLYMGQWSDARSQSSAVIDDVADYGLEDLSNVFLKNSKEAILQWQVNDKAYPYATLEGNNIIPYDSLTQPSWFLTGQLLAAFEQNDRRRTVWVDSSNYLGTYYFYPYKYKVMVGAENNVTEYYMVLRLAEQYLIRAEASAQQNDLNGAIGDLNTIRTRAGLPVLSTTLNQQQVLAAVAQERRIELFAEWGHRWLDLKRTLQADKVLPLYKPQWTNTQELYPLPAGEMIVNPSLKQNDGY